MKNWHTVSIEEALSELKTSAKGISDAEAEARLQQYGPNTLREKRRKSPLKMLLRQFTDFMILVLIAAAMLDESLTWKTVGFAAAVIATVAIGRKMQVR